MVEEVQLKEESFEDVTFGEIAYPQIAVAVKKFLSAYLGEKIYYLEPEDYTNIESIIKNTIFEDACSIPDVLYRHRTITDADEWEYAWENFIDDNSPIPWYETEHWFYNNFFSTDEEEEEDEDEDTFLEDAYDFELTERQRKTKDILVAFDKFESNHTTFTHFMREGYRALNSATRQFMMDFCIFDLRILSDVGFIELQKTMDRINENILEDLSAYIFD